MGEIANVLLSSKKVVLLSSLRACIWAAIIPNMLYFSIIEQKICIGWFGWVGVVVARWPVDCLVIFWVFGRGFFFGFLVLMGFWWALDSGSVVGMMVVWW